MYKTRSYNIFHSLDECCSFLLFQADVHGKNINYPLKQNLSYIIMATRMTSPILDNTLNYIDIAYVDPGWVTSPVNDLKEAGLYKKYP